FWISEQPAHTRRSIAGFEKEQSNEPGDGGSAPLGGIGIALACFYTSHDVLELLGHRLSDIADEAAVGYDAANAVVSIVLLVVESKKTDRISSGTEDFPHLTYNHINT
ncbi:hypothetical protein THAOC_20522, partial [Thalassiosira oceanica]